MRSVSGNRAFESRIGMLQTPIQSQADGYCHPPKPTENTKASTPQHTDNFQPPHNPISTMVTLRRNTVHLLGLLGPREPRGRTYNVEMDEAHLMDEMRRTPTPPR
ncbi:unnamed protein product [Agarophyton chilense]